MNNSKAQGVVLVCGVVTAAIGIVNAARNNHSLPSARFFISGGIIFTVLSGLAELEPDVATSLSIAILTTVIFADKNGALDYLNQRKELDSSPKTPKKKVKVVKVIRSHPSP